MKLIVRFSPVLAALALAMACGDDDDANSNATCKNPYADRSEADLKKQTSKTAACADDSAAVCGNDVITSTSMCAQTCFPMYPTDPAKQASCTQECLQGALSPVPSDGCLACYLESVNCTAQNCFAECLMGGAADIACVNCRLESECTSRFYACSGLPLPTNLTGSTGGTGGTGGTNSGGTAGRTGGTVGMGGDNGMAGMGDAGSGASSGMNAGGAAGMSAGGAAGMSAGGAGSAAGAGPISGAGGI